MTVKTKVVWQTWLQQLWKSLHKVLDLLLFMPKYTYKSKLEDKDTKVLHVENGTEFHPVIYRNHTWK